jgi:tetratricopeptide (TPR) repeat protein
MRVHLAAMAAVLLFGVPAAVAQANGERQTAQSAPQGRAEQLDALFHTLKTEQSEAAAAAESAILRLWMESGSDTVDILMDWALKAMDEKNYALALDFLDRIVTLKPDFVEGWNKRATVFFLTDDYAKSLTDIRRALALEPRHFGALAGLGTILRDLGEDKRALEIYRQALALDPRMDSVRKAIAEIEKDAGGKDI